jgi:hypothetical protein
MGTPTLTPLSRRRTHFEASDNMPATDASHSYGRLSTAFYDLDKPAPPLDALAFHRSQAAESCGIVLEPMCGSGRFLIPLLESGIAIEGVDRSADMLAACRRRAEAKGLIATLYEQGLDALSLPLRYGHAFIPSGSLGLIPRAHFGGSLAGLHAHLVPRAKLLLELVEAPALEAASGERGARTVATADGKTIQYEWSATFDPHAGVTRYEGRYRLAENGSVMAEEVEVIDLTAYRREEVLRALRSAGFVEVEIVEPSSAMPWLRDDGTSLFIGKVGTPG